MNAIDQANTKLVATETAEGKGYTVLLDGASVGFIEAVSQPGGYAKRWVAYDAEGKIYTVEKTRKSAFRNLIAVALLRAKKQPA